MILVSFVHFASSADSGHLERILDPFVGFSEVMRTRRTVGKMCLRTREKERREKVAMMGEVRDSPCVLKTINHNRA